MSILREMSLAEFVAYNIANNLVACINLCPKIINILSVCVHDSNFYFLRLPLILLKMSWPFAKAHFTRFEFCVEISSQFRFYTMEIFSLLHTSKSSSSSKWD